MRIILFILFTALYVGIKVLNQQYTKNHSLVIMNSTLKRKHVLEE